MNDLLDRYFELQGRIHDHFGYVEDWVTIPLRSYVDHFWFVSQREDGSGVVVHSEDPLTRELIEAGRTIYSAVIYTQRHLPRWVYRAGGFTMVCADTRCDGNKYLMIFDDEKECSDKTLMAVYAERWGHP